MGQGTGMRGKDLQKFLMVARDLNVTILVRHTNEDSLKYVQVPGFYPKPAAIKAKTADFNPPVETRTVNNKRLSIHYDVSGLVVHPGFQPKCYKEAKIPKAFDCWLHTMETLAPSLMNVHVDLTKPQTWETWGLERNAVLAPRWQWRVQVNPLSPQFGCIQLRADGIPWSYVHGDYDLKDVIVRGKEQDNRRNEGKLDGVKNFTPVLHELEFEKVQKKLNDLMGVEMVQHGAEAQFAWHGDEPITVAFPDWTFLLLTDATTVQGWYQKLNREVLAKKGLDYQKDRSRMFHFGPDGMFAPGAIPGGSWG
jgi:hypothetical protein